MISHGYGATATNTGVVLPYSLSYLSPPAHLSCSSLFSIRAQNRRARIVASSLPLPGDRIIVGCGGASMDYLVMVDSFPKPDDKIRSTSFKVQGGGNVGNALTCAARLGLKPRIISKVAADSEGRSMLEELEADGVDTSFVVVSKDGRSMFSYVIVDSEMKTRTAIYNPGYPPMTPDDISNSTLSSALDGAKLVYFDGLSLKTALAIAKEASHKGIPILVDAEMGEQGFESLLDMASYAVCSAKYPQAWTQAPSMPSALISMLLKLPNLKFVIVTLGEDGCLMLERSEIEYAALEAVDVDQCFESLKQRTSGSKINPICFSSPMLKLLSDEVGELNGRLFVGTAERIPPSELVDTTGAGDAFIGAVLYGSFHSFSALCNTLDHLRSLLSIIPTYLLQIDALACLMCRYATRDNASICLSSGSWVLSSLGSSDKPSTSYRPTASTLLPSKVRSSSVTDVNRPAEFLMIPDKLWFF